MKKINVRELALEALEKLEQNQAYSNLLLTSVIKTNTLGDQDRGLLTELVYGTLQNKIALDYMLKPFIRKPNKVKPWVIQLLRLSAYQMEYLEKIPDRAAIHEAVEIAKNAGIRALRPLSTASSAPCSVKGRRHSLKLKTRFSVFPQRQAIPNGS